MLGFSVLALAACCPSEVLFKDGSRILGEACPASADSVVIRTQVGMEFKGSAADSVLSSGAIWKCAAPNSSSSSEQQTLPLKPSPREKSHAGDTRYLYAANSIPLGAGNASFSQTQLFYSTWNFGLSDFLTLQVGSVLPAIFVEDGMNLVSGAKVSIPIIKGQSVNQNDLWLSLGTQRFILSEGNVGITFVGGTMDFKSGTGSLNVGLVDAEYDASMVLNSGLEIEANENISVLGELWHLPEDAYSFGAGGVRFKGNRLSADVGFYLLPEVPIPIPWVDFTYKW